MANINSKPPNESATIDRSVELSEPCLIWSNEHGAWWAPGRMGYVHKLADAGRYTLARARYLSQQADLGRCGDRAPNELVVREADALATLRW